MGIIDTHSDERLALVPRLEVAMAVVSASTHASPAPAPSAALAGTTPPCVPVTPSQVDIYCSIARQVFLRNLHTRPGLRHGYVSEDMRGWRVSFKVKRAR